MIICKNVTCGSEDGNKILRDISFTLGPNETGVLIGLPGSGKTTLFDCIGNIRHYDGYIKTENNFRYIKELPVLCDEMTGEEYLNLLLSMRSPEFKKEIDGLIGLIGINRQLSKLIKDAVPYTRKILVFLSALCLENDTIIVDDPFRELDHYSQRKMVEIILKLKEQNKTLLVATNQLSFGFEIADKLFILHNGKVRTVENNFPNVNQYETKLLSLLMK